MWVYFRYLYIIFSSINRFNMHTNFRIQIVCLWILDMSRVRESRMLPLKRGKKFSCTVVGHFEIMNYAYGKYVTSIFYFTYQYNNSLSIFLFGIFYWIIFHFLELFIHFLKYKLNNPFFSWNDEYVFSFQYR